MWQEIKDFFRIVFGAIPVPKADEHCWHTDKDSEVCCKCGMRLWPDERWITLVSRKKSGEVRVLGNIPCPFNPREWV